MEKDINQIAHQIVEQATNPEALSQTQISQIMAHMGRKGGLRGGKARAAQLTPQQRQKIARKAARKRWSKER